MEASMQETDLKTITKEPKLAFYQGKLFHGTNKEFDFDRNFFDEDNNAKRSQPGSPDGSTTLGHGLYFSDGLEAGKKYSSERKNEGDELFVYSTELPDCKFLDFRSEEGNLPVPQEMITKWVERLRVLAETKYSDVVPETPRYTVVGDGPIRRRVIDVHARDRDKSYQYIGFLEDFKGNGNLNLREMLGTAPAPSNKHGFDGSLPFAREGELFRNFVVNDLGYDGIIYNEGLEWDDLPKEGLDSYVVYNLDKIKDLKRV